MDGRLGVCGGQQRKEFSSVHANILKWEQNWTTLTTSKQTRHTQGERKYRHNWRRGRLLTCAARASRKAWRNTVFLYRPNCHKHAPDVTSRGRAFICWSRLHDSGGDNNMQEGAMRSSLYNMLGGGVMQGRNAHTYVRSCSYMCFSIATIINTNPHYRCSKLT